jgi:hypothetical protein
VKKRQSDEMLDLYLFVSGGTELLRPLQYLHSKVPSSGHSRQIFLLTDGEVSNEDEVLNLCRSMFTSSRIFSFGLGHSPSRSLVKGLARATNGCFVFIPPNTPVDIYVAQQLEKALQPCITNVEVKWSQTEIVTAPKKVPPVYANDRLIFYGLLDTGHFQHDTTVSLYKTDNNLLLAQAKVDRIPSTVEDQTISRLAAKAFIHELQHYKTDEPNEKEDDTRKQKMIDLSLKYGILSPYTAFVGIEQRLNGDNSDMALREVPIEISADDKHLFKESQRRSSTSFYSQAFNYSLTDDLEELGSIFSDIGYIVHESGNLISSIDEQCEIINLDSRSSGFRRLTANKPINKPLSSKKSFKDVQTSSSTSVAWPVLEEDIVRYLIDLQAFDGLWSLSDEQIEKLTGKLLSSYPSQYTKDQQVISSAIVLITLEQERFQSSKTLWQACVEKTKRRLAELLGGYDKLELILQKMRDQRLNCNAEDDIKNKKSTIKGNFLTRIFRKMSK